MITVILRGGLGNQMFQYATGIGIAKHNLTSLAIDAAYLNDGSPRGNFTRRSYSLDIFAVKPRLTALSKISEKAPVPALWLGMDFAAAFAGELFGRKFFSEKKGHLFDEQVFNVGNTAVIWGFWQTEKYFIQAEDEVRAAFRFPAPGNEAIVRAKDEVSRVNAVALHVRRGDYLHPKYSKVYGGTDTSYYDAAIAHMAARVKSPTLFVFSDDIAWCKEHIKAPFPVVFMADETAGSKASGHLELMSLCKHNIIANSSFSWWGAWLNENQGKIVVAPKKWEEGLAADAIDTIPAGWVTL
ncbi:MAG TPA: alpha-1,2-fucosyltransferase [Candidatus Paceibacterota bacterium]